MNEQKNNLQSRKRPSWIVVLLVLFLLTFALNFVQSIRNSTSQLQISYDQFLDLVEADEIQNPSTQNRKKLKKIEPPRIWDGSVHEICTIQRKCSLLAAVALLRIGRGGAATERGILPFSTHRPP